MPYANSFDPDEMPSNSASHADGSKLFDTRTTFSPILSDIETLRKLKQTRNLADDNLLGVLGGKTKQEKLVNSKKTFNGHSIELS